MHHRSFVNFCSYQSSSPFHRESKVCEYRIHQFFPSRTHRGLYSLAPGGSCLPLRGSVEPLCLLHLHSSLSLHSSRPVIQKMPSRFHQKASCSLASQEKSLQGLAAVERTLVDLVDRNARSRTVGSSYGDGVVNPSTTKWIYLIM
jgi:hypothetical protein